MDKRHDNTTLEENKKAAKVLLELLSISIGKENISIPKDIDWEAVIKEAEKQAVYLLANEAVQNTDLPDSVKEKWTARNFQYQKSNLHSLFAISEVDRLMKENGFPYVILKGISSAYYYPIPELRILGDVDFLIDPVQRSAIEAILVKEGYENHHKETYQHIGYEKFLQRLELHYRIPGLPFNEIEGIVNDYIKDMIKEPLTYHSDNGSFLIPQSKYHGLIILLHMQHHMLTTGIGFRHLMDWAVYIDKVYDEAFFHEELLPLIKEIGLLDYTAIITKVCALCFHTVRPDWCEKADDEVCKRVYEDILIGGNFGRKNKARSASHIMTNMPEKHQERYSRLHNLLRTSIAVVKNYHPICIQHPILIPLFVPVEALRRVSRVIKGTRAPLYKSVAYAKERDDIYEKLHLFERERKQ